jgi:hypothetical protein
MDAGLGAALGVRPKRLPRREVPLAERLALASRAETRAATSASENWRHVASAGKSVSVSSSSSESSASTRQRM